MTGDGTQASTPLLLLQLLLLLLLLLLSSALLVPAALLLLLLLLLLAEPSVVLMLLLLLSVFLGLQLPSALARNSATGTDATVSPATMATAFRPSCSIACFAASSAATGPAPPTSRVRTSIFLRGVRWACTADSSAAGL
jgi:hypothetical protein